MYLVASCGDDQEKAGKTADVARELPQTPQVIVKEWYPRPKYPPPTTAYVLSAGILSATNGAATIPIPGFVSTAPNEGAIIPSTYSLASVRPVARNATAVSDRAAIPNPATSLGRVSSA